MDSATQIAWNQLADTYRSAGGVFVHDDREDEPFTWDRGSAGTVSAPTVEALRAMVAAIAGRGARVP